MAHFPPGEGRAPIEIDLAAAPPDSPLAAAATAALQHAGRTALSPWAIELTSSIPTGRGMGSSAAVAVALVRAIGLAAGEEWDAATVAALAFAAERQVHGTPSGIDNTVTAYGRPIHFAQHRLREKAFFRQAGIGTAAYQAIRSLADVAGATALPGILKTCTPYLAGNVPARGEHLAWMESSAVIFANSVLGARTNTEGRESTSAAMLTGKIPDWGLHQTEHRYGTHRIDVDVNVDSVMDWGMLGYYVGDVVQERIPVVLGKYSQSEIVRLKHFGAAASSSGGVEMYHIVGVTPEAESLEMAFGPKQPLETFRYGKDEQRRVYDRLNASGRDSNVDFVMLGCPHAAIEQLREAARLLEGKKVSGNCALWIFTSRAVKSQAQQEGIVQALGNAGAVLLTDTCSAFAQALPPGTKVAALDSAKQAHYLPAILGIQAWFGSTTDCIKAALTGRWSGELS